MNESLSADDPGAPDAGRGRAPRRFSDEALELVATRFKVLSEPTRLRILNALRKGERTVSDLAEAAETSQANVSKHLGILRRHDLVTRRKEGLHTHYRLTDQAIFELCEIVCESLEEELESRKRAVSGDD
ncbi:MAG: metalloregulator ArsR/SmtB family transcription factor [Candidatus Palauibacterales bacterium]|nr:metalloregulator ArsR/SmtB family transcription factor [Candidatus Palauibacterales bacterium]